MDDEAPRFTGENPPMRLWSRFPNWELALDEEGLPGQDETTIRPSVNQATIGPDVCFTAGDAALADGSTVPALLCMAMGQLDQVYVYHNPPEEHCWLVSVDPLSQGWVAMNQDWLLKQAGMLRVPVGDRSVFPVTLTSRLPLERSGEPIKVLIDIPA
jgi:hypothetical protein